MLLLVDRLEKTDTRRDSVNSGHQAAEPWESSVLHDQAGARNRSASRTQSWPPIGIKRSLKS